MVKRRRQSVPPGQPPGTLPVATSQASDHKVEIIDYGSGNTTRNIVTDLPEHVESPPPGTVRWIRVSGVPSAALLAHIGEAFGVHALVLEDVASTEQRIKTEDHDTLTYTALRTLHLSDQPDVTDMEIDLLLTDRVLISVDEGISDGFYQPIFARLENVRSLLRRGGADVLFYALADLVVDCFFPLVEGYEDQIEQLESSIAQGPERHHIDSIHQLRSNIRHIRSTLWATRDVTAGIARDGARGMAERTQFYFRDIHDHVIHLLDSVTDLRESAGSLRELHVSQMSNRMNDIMKVLTIIATVFIPLTFVAGVYGMNFVNMPELHTRWGYFGVLGLMVVVAGAMLAFFKRRKWF